MEEQNVKKLSVCVLFGGVSPEHEVSLRSAESVLNNLDKEKYNIFPVGITKTGEWILYGGRDYSKLPTGEWQHCPENRRAAISPVRGQGLLNFEGDCVVRERIDVVFPVLHGENGEDGSIQGLLQLAGLPLCRAGRGGFRHLHGQDADEARRRPRRDPAGGVAARHGARVGE